MEQMTGNYEGFKKETDLAVEKIRTGAMTMAQGAVELGYQLKVARDTGILKESGYTTMSEFAKEEYGIRPDQATRYIQINDKYSENGYSRMLKGKYAGIGVSLLVDMLQLPDTVRDEITQKFSREDIRNLAGEINEESKITDLEVMMEEEDAVQTELLSNLEKTVYQLGKDMPSLYAELFEAVQEGDREKAMEALVPDEEKIYSVRIPGTGRMILSLKTSEEEINLINVRTQEKESYTWQELEETFGEIMHFDGGPEESWEKQYKETFPGTEQKEPNTDKKKPKVEKAKKPEQKKSKPKVQEAVPEHQIPGQDSVENHPEYMPEPQKPEIAPAQPEFEPSPASITSLCYSCSHYSECNAKSGTVRECNEYSNKAEAEKTEEQKYSEEQISIHAPARGASPIPHPRPKGTKFQFTPLREGLRVFSPASPSTVNFNSRPCERGFMVRSEKLPASEYFNSRPCERGFIRRIQKDSKCNQFQFTPLREGLLSLPISLSRHSLFQFTPLREGLQFVFSQELLNEYFNSRPCERGFLSS